MWKDLMIKCKNINTEIVRPYMGHTNCFYITHIILCNLLQIKYVYKKL